MAHISLANIHPEHTDSPYFTLPKPYLLDEEDTSSIVTRSIKLIYGKIENMSDRKQAEFLLRLMAHSEFKPGFDAMAQALNLPSKSAVKQRFKSLCEIHKFTFENNKVEVTDALPDFDAATLPTLAPADVKEEEEVPVAVATPKRKRPYKRKEKPVAAKVEDESDTIEVVERPTKKVKVAPGGEHAIQIAASKDAARSAANAASKAPRARKEAAAKRILSAERVVSDDDDDDDDVSTKSAMPQKNAETAMNSAAATKDKAPGPAPDQDASTTSVGAGAASNASA